MKAYMLFTASGPIVILSTYDVVHHPELLDKMAAHGVKKFIAFELSLDTLKARYGGHYDKTCRDLHQTDDWRVLDESGERIFLNISFDELGEPIYYELKTSGAPSR
jgi:hypothetical protein